MISNARASRSSSGRCLGITSPCSRRWPTPVGEQLGEPDAVLVFDPAGFAKKGVKSVGVAWQWCGRLGKVDNCQVGVSMAYVSRKEHAIVDTRLYLPAEWAQDRGRRGEGGVPETIAFPTRHGLALGV